MCSGTALGFFWALGGMLTPSAGVHQGLTDRQRPLSGGNYIVSLLILVSWLYVLPTNTGPATRNGQ